MSSSTSDKRASTSEKRASKSRRSKDFWDKPRPESAVDSQKLNSYANETYKESFDLGGIDGDDVPTDDDDLSKVINEKDGESGTRIGDVSESGELMLIDDDDDDDEASVADKDVVHGSKGLIYVARLVRDDYFDKKHCLEGGELKARRPMPQAFSNDFLAKVSKNKEGKWIFNGVLNEWPSLTTLEVVSMEYVYQTRGGVFSKRYWRADKHGKKEKPYYPTSGRAFFRSTPKSVRVKLRAPSWSNKGFSQASPGFMFWYNYSVGIDKPRMAHGTNCVSAARAAGNRNVCVRAHHFSHRYPVGGRRETMKEHISYHAGVLLEWDHGQYCTVVELAWLAGLGGYGGKSNWYDDKNSGNPKLYDVMPACTKMPWRNSISEIRVLDIKAKNLKEFKTYLKKYEGERFVKPQINHSGPVRVIFREEEHILQYCLNYIERDTGYTESHRNCETFAADFAGFLLAKTVKPMNKIIRYYDRRHLFFYDASMFEKKKKKKDRYSDESSDVEAAKESSMRESVKTKAKKKLGFRR